jgi:hypothetical protein
MNAHDPVLRATNDPWSFFWDRGYRRLLPISPPDAVLTETSRIDPGKAPGVRHADGRWSGLGGWSQKYATEADLGVWRSWEKAGIGIICDEGLTAFDADTLDPKLAAAIRAAVESRFGLLPLRFGQEPKAVFLCRTDAEFTSSDVEFEGGVFEVRTSGQFVAYGIHKITKKPYRWERAPPARDKLPYFAPSAIEALIADLLELLPNARLIAQGSRTTGRVDQTTLLAPSADAVGRALDLIPNDSRVDRSSWIKMGHAIWAATSGSEDGRRMWEDWSAEWVGPRGARNAPEIVEKEWRSFGNVDKRVGWGWMLREADARTGGKFSPGEFFETPAQGEAECDKSSQGEDGAAEKGPLFPDPPKVEFRPRAYSWPTVIPPRRSLYAGHYVRKWVSSTVAPSKVGKSSLVLAEALAMATGKPLLGVQPEGRFRVWWWNGEDPQDELDRRIAAAIQFYGLTREDVGDRLLVNSGRDMPITLATQRRNSVEPHESTHRALIQAILENKIDASIFDPFISLHKVSENDNNSIDAVAKTCNVIANASDSAIELAHHTRKLYGGGATVEDGRGASALLATTRSTRAMARMTKEEAHDLGVGDEYRLFFHFTDASSNIYAPDARMEEKWFRFESINLGNGEGEDAADRLLRGDRVGVITRVDIGARRQAAIEETLAEPSGDGPTPEERALEAVRRHGDCRKSMASEAWVGNPIAEALGIDRDSAEGVAQLKTIIKKWIGDGKLKTESRANKARQIKIYVVAPRQNVQNESENDLFS